jgi:hypothetical protein
MAGSWQVIAATCHRVFGLFMRVRRHNGRYGTFFQNYRRGEWKRERRQRKETEKGKRVEITIGISCHTCHAFSVFSLGKRFRPIATCHLTCHNLAAGELADEGEIAAASDVARQDWPEWWWAA